MICKDVPRSLLGCVTTTGRFDVGALCSLCSPTAKVGMGSLLKASSDPQQDISEIRCTLPGILLVLVADEISKVYHDTAGVLVALFESFWGVNRWSVWVPQTHR